ncbi:MAG: DUF1559 domain-containing protein [Schlesneria sp.]
MNRIDVYSKQARKGFTLIELMVVIAVIAVLVALILPTIQQARDTARRTQCKNNLRQIGLALQNYCDIYGRFPPGYVASSDTTATTPGWGWGAMILPQMDQFPLFGIIDFSLPIEHPLNSAPIATRLPTFLCASDIVPNGTFTITNAATGKLVQTGPSSYVGCVGNESSSVDDNVNPGNGMLFRNSSVRFAEVLDGTSNTILVAERAWARANGTWIGAPNTGRLRAGTSNRAAPLDEASSFHVLGHAHWINAINDPTGGLGDFSSMHTGGINAAFVDGSVRFLHSVTSDGGSANNIQTMGTRAGGEITADFGY